MSSENERREVAKRLRFCAKATNGTIEFSICLSHWVGVDGVTDDQGNLFSAQADRREAELTLEKLADLIDPTCENEAVKLNRMAPLEMRTDNLICSSCGETFCADQDGINNPIDWVYCPNCGARVVDDGQ